MHYQYSDSTIGPARQVTHADHVYPATYLGRREDRETEAEWVARLAAIGVAPVRYITPDYDPAIQVLGYQDQSVEDGVVIITWTVSDRPDALDIAYAAKRADIRDRADAILVAAGPEYGTMERTTWETQLAEAEAYDADPEAATPMLTAIATARGMTVSGMAARVLANRDAWVALSGAIVGQRLALQDQLDACATVAEVLAIEVSYTIPS